MQIVDEKLLQDFRTKSVCEVCFRKVRTGLDPHHIFSRGAGRLDVAVNLIALCRDCHSEVHNGKITRSTLMQLVAKREHLDYDDILLKIWQLRRSHRIGAM